MELNKKHITILEKAFSVWSDKMDAYDLHYAKEDVYHAKSPAQAIRKFLSSEWGYDLEFSDCRTKRIPSFDKIVYNDGNVCISDIKYKIEEHLSEIERMNKIRLLPDDTMFYVQDKRNYVGNSVVWWGKDENGYVIDPNKAMKVTKEYILSKKWRNTDVIWEATEVENNISWHVDAQYLKNNKSY